MIVTIKAKTPKQRATASNYVSCQNFKILVKNQNVLLFFLINFKIIIDLKKCIIILTKILTHKQGRGYFKQ